MLKQVSQQGLIVEKIDSVYTISNGKVLLLKTMNGNKGYLVRMVENLFN